MRSSGPPTSSQEFDVDENLSTARAARSTTEIPLASAARAVATRRGTVIIVVLALLGMLALMGFFVFAFTASENQSATYFANSPSAKVPTATINADALFNNVLRQIIVGPAITEKQSALWGGRASLLPTMFGRDLSPYNGAGVNLFWNTALNQASVDQNYDATPDDGTAVQQDNRALSFLNLSPSAAVAWQANTAYVTGAFVRPNANPQTNYLYIATTPGTSGGSEPTWPGLPGTVTDGTVNWITATSLDLNNYPFAGNLYPDPDVNITYPDNNSPYLAYDGLVPNYTNPSLPTRLITPSFHRPQYLRNATAATGLGNVPVANWYVDPLTAPFVLYPHVEHTAIDNKGNITTSNGSSPMRTRTHRLRRLPGRPPPPTPWGNSSTLPALAIPHPPRTTICARSRGRAAVRSLLSPPPKGPPSMTARSSGATPRSRPSRSRETHCQPARRSVVDAGRRNDHLCRRYG